MIEIERGGERERGGVGKTGAKCNFLCCSVCSSRLNSWCGNNNVLLLLPCSFFYSLCRAAKTWAPRFVCVFFVCSSDLQLNAPFCDRLLGWLFFLIVFFFFLLVICIRVSLVCLCRRCRLDYYNSTDWRIQFRSLDRFFDLCFFFLSTPKPFDTNWRVLLFFSLVISFSLLTPSS